jgi:hypothetical protein
LENQIICPHCKKTIPNDSVIDCAVKEAGLVSTFVFCECGEKIPFMTIISQLRDQNSLLQGSKIDSINSSWIESRLELP